VKVNLKVAKKRRQFISLLPLALAGAFSYPLYRFIFYNQDSRGDFHIAISNIKDGITKINSHEIFIYKIQDSIAVFDAHCTHMGCILHFDKDQKIFNCPCHKSRFAIDGSLIRGPAKRDLDIIKHIIKNKILFLG
jgi:cytochrome b6-f complex iron-sulfur subunit